jgi:sporulation protein YlmC with PRC-barrel domain
MEISVRKIFRVSKVIGMPVKTTEGDKLGEIEDVAVNIETGQVAYVVLSFGGFFGLANKWFAVPWAEFSLVNDERENYFTIETTKDKLKKLPGFDKEDWPDLVNSDWDKLVEEHHRKGGENSEANS